ncbi:MAG: hypothetical protein LBH92_07830 [Bacteroidales bacterium]|nr:hypothetical protein [Bacteroidales bacterium]
MKRQIVTYHSLCVIRHSLPRLILFAVIFGGFFNVGAQTVISGKITNEEGQTVPNASVTLLKIADSSVVAYSFGKETGEYAVYYNGQEKELLLSVYGFNIQRQFKKIKNETQTVDFAVVEESLQLKEVTIKAVKVWGNRDTINYAVEAFRDSTDMVIADVLKKMPGIEVGESGDIQFRGKPIKKFYIENMDMLQGRYGIATNNLNAVDVATVQVLEGHQPIKALEDIGFTDDVAINLKLKEGAKGTYSAMADLAAGVDFDEDFLWNGSLTAMFFGKRRQHMLSYKSNNSGNDIYREFQSFTSEDTYMPPLTNIVAPSPPQTNKNRYFFNQGHGISFTTLLKTKNDDEFTINLIGYRDSDDRNSRSLTTYYVPGADTIFINERLSSHSTINKLEGDLVYHKNQPKNYLNNTLKFTGSWENSAGFIDNAEPVNQSFHQRNLKLSNHLTWIMRSDNKKGFELNSKTYFQSQPYALIINPGVFADLLNDTLPYHAVKQDILFTSFETVNNVRLLSSFVWKSLMISPYLLVSIEYQSINSHIYKALTEDDFIQMTDNLFENDLNWLRSKTGLGLNFEYRKKRFNLNLSTPVYYQYISLMGEDEKHPRQHRALFQPILSLRYTFTSRWELSSSYRFYNSNPNLSRLYSGYILQDYRTISRYQNDLTDSYGNSAFIKLSYKSVLDILFADLSFGYNNYYNKVMYGQEFEGTAMKIYLVEMKNSGDYFSLNGRINKGFYWKKLSFNLAGSWGKGNTPILRNEQLINYTNQGVNANLTASLSITKKIAFADKLSWSYITGSADGEKLNPMINFINWANLDVSILNNLILTTACEYFNIKSAESTRHFYLFDMGIMYTFKKVRLSLDWNNILNTDTYIYSYYGNLNADYSEYKIRPSSIMLRARFKLF